MENKKDREIKGAMAAATDKPQTSCPYDFDTAAGRQWLEGFRDGGVTHNTKHIGSPDDANG